MTSAWLDVADFAELVGCSPARLRVLVRCGLLRPWERYIAREDAPAVAVVPQLVVMDDPAIPPQVVRFHRDLVTDARFLVLVTNSVDPRRWGPGWPGSRDERLTGLMDARRVKVMKPGSKITTAMKRISRIPIRAPRSDSHT